MIEKEDHINQFQAGAAKVDITPSLGSIIGVDFLSHYVRFINDPLYVKSMVFRSGDIEIALVVLDTCIIPSDLILEMKKQIQEKTGIGPSNIMLSATHTHGAGDVAGLLGGAVDIVYRRQIIGNVAKSVQIAQHRLRPAKVLSGAVDVPDHMVCRRYRMQEGCSLKNPVTGDVDQVKTNPSGLEDYIQERVSTPDPQCAFLMVKGMDDRWIGFLGNYSLHYVGDWDMDTITADYYGRTSEMIREKLSADDDFIGMMTFGTGGDVNIWDFLDPHRYPEEDFAKTELISNDLSDAILSTMNKSEWEVEPELACHYKETSIAINKPTDLEYDKAMKLLSKHRFDRPELDDFGLSLIYAREQLLLDQYPDQHTSVIQVIKIGKGRFGAVGGELFSETGIWLKSKVDGPYFTICLANSYDGYVPPADEFDLGGYETWRARSSFLVRGAEKVIREELLALVQQLN